eukprot:9302779-Ditylum_brightwellii.AAC.1
MGHEVGCEVGHILHHEIQCHMGHDTRQYELMIIDRVNNTPNASNPKSAQLDCGAGCDMGCNMAHDNVFTVDAGNDTDSQPLSSNEKSNSLEYNTPSKK